MAASVLAATRAALIAVIDAALVADGDFPKTQTRFSWRSDWATKEKVFTHGGRMDHDPAALRAGATVRNESGEFDVLIEVMLPGRDATAAIDRAFEIDRVVGEQIALHKNDLAVPGLLWIRSQGVVLDAEGEVDQGSGARVVHTVHFEARL